MTLEQLVPSLEVCLRAQGLGYSTNTQFCWHDLSDEEGVRFILDDTITQWQEYTRLNSKKRIPAPTLQEVLEELGHDMVVKGATAEAALELWCELEEKKVKQ